jgi:uncharacterized membrane protein YkvA (DUF1232 family)
MSQRVTDPAPRWSDRLRGWAARLSRDVHALYLCARDRRVPWYAKALAFAVAAYAVSPLDLIPDFIPVIGLLDDLLLVPIGIYLTIRLIPPDVLAEARRRAAAGGQAPRDWRAGALVVALWLITAAALVYWAAEWLAG